jgi:hypothetical protein
MYSPKISEELIPSLYRAAKRERKPMTKLVNRIIGEWLKGGWGEKEEAEKNQGMAVKEDAQAVQGHIVLRPPRQPGAFVEQYHGRAR